MLPGEVESVSECTGLSGRAKSVKRFERSNGLDIAIYKNYLYLCFITDVSPKSCDLDPAPTWLVVGPIIG